MPFPAIGVGAATLAGSLITNFANAAAARSQMRFQERMANTSHQRQAKDLRKAGINPLLGAGGVGAPTPVGSKPEFEDSIGKAVHSGMNARMQAKQLELLEAQIAKEWSAEALNYAHNTQVTNMTQPMVNELNARVGLHLVDTETKRAVVGLVAQHMSADIAQKLSSALQSKAGAAHADAQSILLRFQQQEFKNMSEAQKSFWMRSIAPYLNSAAKAVGTAAAIAVPALGARAVLRGGGAALSRAGSAASRPVRQGKSMIDTHRVFQGPD